jgi:hypothetical protein
MFDDMVDDGSTAGVETIGQIHVSKLEIQFQS